MECGDEAVPLKRDGVIHLHPAAVSLLLLQRMSDTVALGRETWLSSRTLVASREFCRPLLFGLLVAQPDQS